MSQCCFASILSYRIQKQRPGSFDFSSDPHHGNTSTLGSTCSAWPLPFVVLELDLCLPRQSLQHPLQRCHRHCNLCHHRPLRCLSYTAGVPLDFHCPRHDASTHNTQCRTLEYRRPVSLQGHDSTEVMSSLKQAMCRAAQYVDSSDYPLHAVLPGEAARSEKRKLL
jgi:hypothetical protein